MTCGTCAVGVHMALGPEGVSVTAGNLGDSRVVCDIFEAKAQLRAVPSPAIMPRRTRASARVSAPRSRRLA